MKIYLLFIVSISLVFYLPGKGQVNFLDSTYIWTEHQYPMSGEPYTTRYTFSTVPTEIEGLFYYERLLSNEGNGNNWGHTYIFYRSDATGKVFVNNHYNEYPVYDYNLSVGDSLAIGEYGIILVVSFIDSITLENGEKRKRLAMRCSFDIDPNPDWGYKYWIEGIGGTNGIQDYFFNDCLPDGGGTSTLCISRNDTLLYDNPNADSCWFTTVSTVPVKEDPVVIFPNPTSNVIQISGVTGPIEVNIWNSAGDFISKHSENLIDFRHEPPGMYFISVNLTGDKKKSYFRIIKL